MSKFRSRTSSSSEPVKINFDVPSWASISPPGTHLDVMKGDKLIEKLIIDEKKCYYFGRNAESCDFLTEHASCSRVHAVLMYHKHLQRMFIVDLGSVHGSYIWNSKLEGHKPTPIPFDAQLRFGASTRYYILKERPQVVATCEGKPETEEMIFELPEEQEELDNLTEFNTAHNKRVSAIALEEPPKFGSKRKRKSVIFAADEEIINLEDVDSSVGRFRNMVSVEIIPNKRMKGESTGLVSQNMDIKKHVQEFYNQGLYEDLDKNKKSIVEPLRSLHSKLTNFVPNLAPDIEETTKVSIETNLEIQKPQIISDTEIKSRKKYVKEAWPGKRPAPSLLV